MIQLLHEDAHFRVELNAPEQLVRVAARAPGGLAAIERVLDSVPRGGKLFLDLRDAPSGDARPFERLFSRFARVAVLSRKAVPIEGQPATVASFDDEDRAFDHLYV